VARDGAEFDGVMIEPPVDGRIVYDGAVKAEEGGIHGGSGGGSGLWYAASVEGSPVFFEMDLPEDLKSCGDPETS
jgi:hypothetical protein